MLCLWMVDLMMWNRGIMVNDLIQNMQIKLLTESILGTDKNMFELNTHGD